MPDPDVIDAAGRPGVDPSGDADSTSGLQRALDEAGTGDATRRVVLRAGTYLVSAPLVIPPAVTLEGITGMLGADPWTTFTRCAIRASPAFSGEAVISVRDARLGGYPRGSGNQQVRRLMVDGRDSPPGVDGIKMTGPVQGFQIDDVCVYRVKGNGITGTADPACADGQRAPYNVHAARVRVHFASGSGLSLASVTDSTWLDVHAIGCSTGWDIAAGANTRYIGCRAELSRSHGFHVKRTGSGAGSGGIAFVACSTDGNAYSGFLFSGAGHAPATVSGCMARGDAARGGQGNAGLRVNGAAYPVLAGDLTVYPADGGPGKVTTPRTGLIIENSPGYVGVSNALVHAGACAVCWDGSGTVSMRNVAVRTGSPSAPSPVTMAAGQ